MASYYLIFTCLISDFRFIIEVGAFKYQECMQSAVFTILCVCEQMPCESALRLLLEAQIREEVGTEFLELFNKMEKDYR